MILRICDSSDVTHESGGSVGKESACNAGDLGSIPALGRSPGGGHGNALQYSCLENPHAQRCLAGYSSWGRKESEATEPLHTAQHRTPGSHASCRNVSIAVATRWRARVTGPSPTQLRIQPPSLLWGSHCKVPFSDGIKVKEAGGKTAITMFFLSIQRSTMQELKGTRAGRWFYCQMSLT